MRLTSMVFSAVLLVALSGQACAHEEKLEGSEWGVVGDEGPKARYISFAGSGRVFGFGGCNRFSGTYEQHDHHLTLSPMAATRMACPEDVMKKESDFFALLSRVRGVRVDHTLLLFLDEAGADLKALTRRDTGSGGGSDEQQ
ncbi:META domain-containing protein [Aestuariivirga sp.]|uniref:META domain-containing protein n=1 Tax=Aestuariivirga sp. TaxID=2650926 RepID=UPI0035937C3C